jgi:hypothetical protein
MQFESSLNFEGVQTFGLTFITVNLFKHTSMQEIEVSIKVSIWLGLKIKK